MKVFFKIFAVLLVLIIIALVSLPFILEKNVDTLVRKAIDGKVNAQIDYDDIDLSLIKSFPKAQVDLKGLKIITNAPFANDTLVYAEDLLVNVSLMQFFKKSVDQIAVDKVKISDAVIKLMTNKAGKANFDIAIKDENAVEEEQTTDESAGFGLNIDYEINKAKIVYADSTSKTYVVVDNLMHTGKGDVSANVTDLDTNTDLNLTFEMAGMHYTNKMPISLRAIIEADLANQKYSFKENEAHLNQIPLVFNGWVQVLDTATDMDISFSSEKASFKNLLASIPQAYKADLKGVSASGKFDLHGTIKGKQTETTIPKLDISLDTRNASFKYPDLPKGVNDITIVGKVINNTGVMDDTHIDLDAFNMRIDQDTFAASGMFSNLLKNPTINAKAKGTVNLGNLKNAYPIGDQDMDLTGVVNADVEMKFSQNDIDTEQYQNIYSEGNVAISNFLFESEELPSPVKISNMDVAFTPQKVSLQEFAMTTGSSDLQATGTLENIIPFVFSEKVLKGDFSFKANTFKVSDFMTASAEENTDNTDQKNTEEPVSTAEEGLIPSFLDFTSSFEVATVYYDNLELKNAKGNLTVKDQKASLSNISADFFDGTIGMLGEVSTANDTPTFDMELDLSKLDITQSFSKIEMLQKMAPIASALNGLFSSEIKLKGNLTNELTPDLSTLSGSAVVKLLNAKVNPEGNNMLSSLNQKTDFVNFDKLNMNNLSTSLAFEDGKIAVKPFDFNITNDIKVTASGSHAFDAGIDYNLDMDVPAKYLGSSASGLLSKLSAQEQKNIKVPVPVTIGGSMQKPQIGVDLKSGISSLTQQIVANQKQQLTNKVTSKVTEKVSEQISSKVSNQVSDKAKNVVSGLLNKKTTNTEDKKEEEETKTDTKETVKNAASKALNSLFNKK